MTKTEENRSKTGYLSLVAGEDCDDDSGPANRLIIDKPHKRDNKNCCKCPKCDRWGGNRHAGIVIKRGNISQCLKGEPNLRLRPILYINQLLLKMIRRCKKKENHNTRRRYYSMMYDLESFESQRIPSSNKSMENGSPILKTR